MPAPGHGAVSTIVKGRGRHSLCLASLCELVGNRDLRTNEELQLGCVLFWKDLILLEPKMSPEVTASEASTESGEEWGAGTGSK